MNRNVKRNNKGKANKLREISRFWVLIGITLIILGTILVFVKNSLSNENKNRNETKEIEAHILEIPNQNESTEPMQGENKRW